MFIKHSIIMLTFFVIGLYLIPQITGPVWLTFISFSLVIGIACMGLNLLVGHMGLLSLGHAAYFGIGAYTVALLMWWYAIRGVEILLFSGAGSATLVALLVGYVASKLNRIYFSIFTLTVSQVVWSILVKSYYITGGASGIYVEKPIVLGYDALPITRLEFLFQFYYYYIASFFLIMVLLSWIILKSPIGLVMKAIRINSERTEFLGISVRRFRWYIFTVSGLFCGLSGALFAILNGAIHPGFSDWLYSFRLLLPIIIGGQRYLLGPLLGIFLLNIIETVSLSTLLTWRLMVGAMLIAIVFLMPDGVAGLLHKTYFESAFKLYKGKNRHR